MQWGRRVKRRGVRQRQVRRLLGGVGLKPLGGRWPWVVFVRPPSIVCRGGGVAVSPFASGWKSAQKGGPKVEGLPKPTAKRYSHPDFLPPPPSSHRFDCRCLIP